MHPLLVLDELVLRGCMKLKLSFATARLGHGVYYSTWHWRVYFVTSKHGHVLAFQISMARSLSKPQFSSSRAMLRWSVCRQWSWSHLGTLRRPFFFCSHSRLSLAFRALFRFACPSMSPSSSSPSDTSCSTGMTIHVSRILVYQWPMHSRIYIICASTTI